MLRKMFAIATAVAAGLVVVGVAWAGTDATTSTSITSGDSSSTSIDDSSSSSSPSITSATTPDSTSSSLDQTTSTSTPSATSTSLDDDDEDTSTSTSTSIPSTTSTSSGASTSSSIDDSEVAPPDGVNTYSISGVGTVTIEVRNGSLHLLAVSATGWQHDIDKAESDRIEIEFQSGDAEAEFEARLHHGGIEVRTKLDSD